MNKIEIEIVEKLNKQKGILFEIIEDASIYFKLIYKKFPFQGNNIDWEELSIRKSKYVDTSNLKKYYGEAVSFLVEVINDFHLSKNTSILVINDSAFDVAFRINSKDIVSLLPIFLESPQNLYLLNDSACWCIGFQMNGYIDFGQSIEI